MRGTNQIDRRTVLRSLAGTAGAAAMTAALPAAQSAGAPLPRWVPGDLEIHHIDTGLGNSTLILCPDGTTLMIDAGASSAAATTAPARPDASRRPGEWIARYALRRSPSPRLDYFVATHIHPDHIGDLLVDSPAAPGGAFRLTGVSDVDAAMPIGTVVDRAFPHYEAHPMLQAPFAANYRAYLQARVAGGRAVEAAEVGSDSQIRLCKRPAAYPSFKVRLLAADAKVWNGRSGAQGSSAPPAGHPLPENSLSVALHVKHGRFGYFAGGDLTCDTEDGAQPWLDVETATVRACGRVEVAAADHHGYFDSCGPEFVRSLDAQVYVIPSWDVGHPGSAQMQRLLGDWSGATRLRDVFATDLLPANAVMNRRFAPHLKGRAGHVVIRVTAGGERYFVHQVDSSREDGGVLATFGPYFSRREAAATESLHQEAAG